MKNVEKVCSDVWKIKADSNLYIIIREEPFIIDTGRKENKYILQDCVTKIIDPKKIKKVIFSHLHYDHIGNFDFFPNAEYFASKIEIEDFKTSPNATILNPAMVKMFSANLSQLTDFDDFIVIPTPGHTRGSVSIWYPQKKVLFSGDTLFFNNATGRVDLPTSSPKEMNSSLILLKNLDYAILCPGHEY